MKTLVVYYSQLGETRKMAELIAERVENDMYVKGLPFLEALHLVQKKLTKLQTSGLVNYKKKQNGIKIPMIRKKISCNAIMRFSNNKKRESLSFYPQKFS